MIKLESYSGQQILPYIERVAQLRIEGFRNFPYLYDGDQAYEAKYLACYSKEPHALLVCAWDGDILAGIATSLPLTSSSDIVANAPDIFRANQLNPDSFYYFSEIIVRPQYQQQGIAREIYSIREKHAESLGLTNICLAVVERSEHHPLRPQAYATPEYIWQRQGFETTDMKFSFNWPTIQADGKVINQKNGMSFWTKHLSTHR